MRPKVSVAMAIAAMAMGAQADDSAVRPKSTVEFIRTIHGYPYRTDPARASKVLTSLHEVHRCMTVSQVLKLLGEPDFSSKGFKDGTAEFGYDVWTYALEIPEPWDVGSRVMVWFDFTGRARALTFNKVAGEGFKDDEKEMCG